VSGRHPSSSNEAPGARLRADCARCFALCCVAPAFSASSDFAISKDAGQPCPNLEAGFGCSIHGELRPRGFAGCTVYDCFGAGQQVAQVTFGGRDWRQAPGTARQMFAVFGVMRQLHELLWYLGAALALPAARPAHDDLRRVRDEIAGLTGRDAGDLAGLDVNGYRHEANALLRRASELARGGALPAADLPAADLIGADLRSTDLRRASLRGALLVGADLRGADLALADLTGADLRGTRLAGADLSASLFVTQAQLDAAAGDAGTRIPAVLARPPHWDEESPAG
jgi:uncharacterized protein YjbI with pentapeptide repeats